MNESPRIAIAWKGLPAYGARLIRGAQQAIDEPIAVIGTRATVAVADVESILGGPIQWIDDDRPVRWSELGLRPPELFIETAWATPAFNDLTRQVKQAGGKVVSHGRQPLEEQSPAVGRHDLLSPAAPPAVRRGLGARGFGPAFLPDIGHAGRPDLRPSL